MADLFDEMRVRQSTGDCKKHQSTSKGRNDGLIDEEVGEQCGRNGTDEDQGGHEGGGIRAEDPGSFPQYLQCVHRRDGPDVGEVR